MVKRCCIDGCTSNYGESKATYNKSLKVRNDLKNSSRKNVRVFRFPKSLEERRRWVKSIPYFTEGRLDQCKTPPVVCIKHWPAEFPIVKTPTNGKEQPATPPSIFEGIPASDIPSPPPPPPPPRPTKRSSFEVRSRMEDEIDKFKELDKVSFEEIAEEMKFGNRRFAAPTV